MSYENTGFALKEQPIVGHLHDIGYRRDVFANAGAADYESFQVNLVSQLRDIARTFDLAQITGAASLSPEYELSAIKGLSGNIGAHVPQIRIEGTPAVSQHIIDQARLTAVAFAEEIVSTYPQAVLYIISFLGTKVGYDIYDTLKRIGVDINDSSYTISVERRLDWEEIPRFYSAVFAHVILKAFRVVQQEFLMSHPPQNPVLKAAHITDTREKPTRQNIVDLAICMDVLEKVAYLVALGMPPSYDEQFSRYRSSAYEGVLSTGSAILRHELFPHDDVDVKRLVHPELLKFVRNYDARAQNLARMARKEEFDITARPADLNWALWRNGNRDDSEELSALLTQHDGELLREHQTSSRFEDRVTVIEAKMDEAIKSVGQKDRRDGNKYALTGKVILDAINDDTCDNYLVRALRRNIAIRHDYYDDYDSTVRDIFLVLQAHPEETEKSWKELYGIVPDREVQELIITIAVMNEGERKRYYQHLQQSEMRAVTQLADNRAHLKAARRYWEQGPHGDLFCNGKEKLMRRFETAVPVYWSKDEAITAVSTMVLFEKVRLLIKDMHVIPESQFEALDAVIEMLQIPENARLIANTYPTWQMLPPSNWPNVSRLLSSNRQRI